MKITKLAFNAILVSACIVISTTIHAAGTQWWEKYSKREGFTEALIGIDTSLEKLKQNPAQALKDSEDGRMPLHWLKRTMEMYPIDNPSQYNIPIPYNHGGWNQSQQATMIRGIFFFTKIYGKKGESIQIKSGAIPKGAICYAATSNKIIKTTDDSEEIYHNTKQLASNASINYTFSETGLLLLGCSDPKEQQDNKYVKIDISGGRQADIFILGQNTRSDWENIRQGNNDIGFIPLFDGRINTRVPLGVAKVTTENIFKTLGDNLRVTSLYEKINGMDGSKPFLIPSQGSFFASYDKCCYAKFFDGFVAIGSYSDRINDPGGDNWGVWHELGHQYEPVFEGQLLFSEIQVNRYSIEACKMFNHGRNVPLQQCHPNIAEEEGNWDKHAVENFLASGVRYENYNAIKDLWKQLGFFTRLRFSYGEDFYPRVNQIRLQEIHNALGNSMYEKAMYVSSTQQKLIDFSVVAYSKAAKQDLRDYFTQWGMHFSATAGQKVAEMNLPKPGEKGNQAPVVTLNRNSINTIGTNNSDVGYTVAGSSNQENVTWKWEHVGGDSSIYLKSYDKASAEVVVPKKLFDVSAKFRLTATNSDGETGEEFVTVNVAKPVVAITGPSSMTSASPVKMQAKANFDQVTYQWKLKQDRQEVINGIDQSGQIKSGLAAGNYSVEVTANSPKGDHFATGTHVIDITTGQQQAQNNDLAFINALVLSVQPADSGNSVTFSGNVSSSSVATSTPVYQWTLPSGAQGGSNGLAQQSFIINKTSQVQNLKVKVKVTADKETRELEQNITVLAASGGNENYPDWVYGNNYKAGDVVKHKGKLFECVMAGWCSQTGQWSQLNYEPEVGISWAQAWKYYNK